MSRTFWIACAFTAFGIVQPSIAGWNDYLFSPGTTFSQFIIDTPGSGGIYSAVAPNYIYSHGLDNYGNALYPWSFTPDIYNTGYLSFLSQYYSRAYGSLNPYFFMFR